MHLVSFPYSLVPYGFLAALAIALLAAGLGDLLHRRIANRLTGAMALAAPLYWWAAGLPVAAVGWQAGLALGCLILGTGLFAMGVMGGGDVKLLTALALWIQPLWYGQMLVVMALAGGLLALLWFALSGKGALAHGARRLQSVRQRHAPDASANGPANGTRLLDGQLRKLAPATAASAAGAPAPRQGIAALPASIAASIGTAIISRLHRTGLGWSLRRYIEVSTGLGVGVGALVLLKTGSLLAALLLGCLTGGLVPHAVLGHLITRRQHGFIAKLPEAIELLVICAEAGLTIDAAFARIARELEVAYPELSSEFALTAVELSFLSERRQAFENLAYRVDLDSMKGVTTTMIQTERYGTPLASALRILAADFRNERMMRAEEVAARLPAIMTLPLVMFILPVLFVVIMGPAACTIADAFAK